MSKVRSGNKDAGLSAEKMASILVNDFGYEVASKFWDQVLFHNPDHPYALDYKAAVLKLSTSNESFHFCDSVVGDDVSAELSKQLAGNDEHRDN